MQHDDVKEYQKASLISRILSMEALLLLAGVSSLIYGLMTWTETSIFFGALIIPAVFLLHKVKKKDWKAHWAELEEQQRRDQERLEARKRDGN